MCLWRLSTESHNIIGLLLLCISLVTAEPINIFINVSYLIGETLVNCFVNIYYHIVNIFPGILLFLQILFEDGLVFAQDVMEKGTDIYFALCHFGSFIQNIGLPLVSTYVYKFLQVILTFGETVTAVARVFGNTILDGCYTLFSLLLHVWIFISSSYKIVLSNIGVTTNFIVNCRDEIPNIILLISSQLSETFLKFSSVLLFFASCSLVIILFVAAFKLPAFLSALKNYFYSDGSGLLKAESKKNCQPQSSLEKSQHSLNYCNDYDQFCVVCQLNYKEVVIFPCRHLCLCCECNDKIFKIFSCCPICCTQIKETIKVYL